MKGHRKQVPKWYLICSIIITLIISGLFFFSGYDLPNIDNFYFLILGVIGMVLLISWIVFSLIFITMIWKQIHSKSFLVLPLIFITQLILSGIGLLNSAQIWYFTLLDVFAIITIVAVLSSIVIILVSLHMLKMKRIILYVLLTTLLILGFCLSFLTIKASLPKLEINENVPLGFLYTSSQENIPEQFYLGYSFETINTGSLLFDMTTGELYCKEGKLDQITYYSHSSGRYVAGGGKYRYALICGESYWIVDDNDAIGVRIYGPFLVPEIN